MYVDVVFMTYTKQVKKYIHEYNKFKSVIITTYCIVSYYLWCISVCFDVNSSILSLLHYPFFILVKRPCFALNGQNNLSGCFYEREDFL